MQILTPVNDNVGITAVFDTKNIPKGTEMKITGDGSVDACDTAADESIGHCFVAPREDGGEGTVQTRFGYHVKAACDGAIVAGAHFQMGDTAAGVQRYKTYAGTDPRVDLGVCLVGAGNNEEGEFLRY